MGTLTVWCSAGLANRLKVWTSAQVVAEAAGRPLEMLWPVSSHCGAGFARLFEADPRVRDVTLAEVEGLPVWRGKRQELPDLLHEPIDTFGSTRWLVDSKLHPAHAALWPGVRRRLAALRLTPTLRARVDVVARGFRRRMIGVHVRRGDFLTHHRAIATSSTTEALWLTRRELDRRPDAGIFLATDDGAAARVGGASIAPEGVVDRFREAFGARVVSVPPTDLDRTAATSIEDAAVELWLLRKTDVVIGTRWSTFSELAAFGREAPLYQAGGNEERVARIERFARRSGIRPLIMALARRDLGRAPESFHEAWLRVRTLPLTERALAALRWLGWGSDP